MRTIYRLTALGWIRVTRCPSFAAACRKARELADLTRVPHCVNS